MKEAETSVGMLDEGRFSDATNIGSILCNLVEVMCDIRDQLQLPSIDEHLPGTSIKPL